MSDAVSLRNDATDLGATAYRCRVLADDIDRRRRLLAARVEPVVARHRPDVWDSVAADRSREMFTGQVMTDLWFLATDLGVLVHRLRAESDDLETRSSQLVAAAEMLESPPVDQAVPDGTDNLSGDALDAPLGAALSAPHTR